MHARYSSASCMNAFIFLGKKFTTTFPASSGESSTENAAIENIASVLEDVASPRACKRFLEPLLACRRSEDLNLQVLVGNVTENSCPNGEESTFAIASDTEVQVISRYGTVRMQPTDTLEEQSIEELLEEMHQTAPTHAGPQFIFIILTTPLVFCRVKFASFQKALTARRQYIICVHLLRSALGKLHVMPSRSLDRSDIVRRNDRHLEGTDFRVAHLRQLQSLARVVIELTERTAAPRDIYELKAAAERRGKSLRVIGFLFMAAKSARFYECPKLCTFAPQNGIFDWTPTEILIPLCPSTDIAMQVNTLSVYPHYVFSKVSDWLVSLHSRDACEAIKSLHQFFTTQTTLLAVPPISLKTQLQAPATAVEDLSPDFLQFLDRFQFPLLFESARQLMPMPCSIEIPPHVCLHSADACDLSMVQRACTNTVGFKFPALVKTRIGGGPPESHELALVRSAEEVVQYANRCCPFFEERYAKAIRLIGENHNDEPLAARSGRSGEQIEPFPAGVVVQMFIEHQLLRVLKVFLLGNRIFLIKQPSILPFKNELEPVGKKPTQKSRPDFWIGRPSSPLYFNSGELKSRSNFVYSLEILEDRSGPPPGSAYVKALATASPRFSKIDVVPFVDDNGAGRDKYRHAMEDVVDLDKDLGGPISKEVILMAAQFVSKLRSVTKCQLFGVDLLECVEPDAAQHFQVKSLVPVDVNYFPSYSGTANLRERFLEALALRLR